MKKGRQDAQADWDSFAQKLGQEFFEEVVLSGIADTLINDPPRKLMSEGLTWKPDEPPRLENVAGLFVQGVCRVRNSFVHGEKFRSQGKQRERDATLVHEALAVLRLAEAKEIVHLPPSD